jgi:hypothetical protein
MISANETIKMCLLHELHHGVLFSSSSDFIHMTMQGILLVHALEYLDLREPLKVLKTKVD